MASIRRTLSPVPRPGTLVNGEACSVSSPLSKSSSCTQHDPTPVGMIPSFFGRLDYVLDRTQALILGLFSRRHSRPLERPKPKGRTWRRSFVHFFICFVLGVFYGLASFGSTNLPLNHISKNQAFSFKLPPEKVQMFDILPENVTPFMANSTLNDDALLGQLKLELLNGTSNDPLATQSLDQDLNTTVHKLLIIVTPTYARPFQAYYLNRLAQTLKQIPPPLLWLVVDMGSQSTETADILRRNGGVMYRHLVCNKNLTDMKYRSVHQRNEALFHIETHRLEGIVYFADGENIYSIDLFVQLRQISCFSTCRRFGTWMVAKLMESNSRALLEGSVCNGTQVMGWHTNDEVTQRFPRFHAEMSGFAFNSTILWDPKRWQRPSLEPIRQLDAVNGGFQVSSFIEQVVEDESQMECLPHDYSRIMVWHLHVGSSYSYPPEWFLNNNLNVIASLS
ncbi:hypothetical protein RHGRI_005328 [Rhododendron griersonianum]|uniref:Glycosyltransferases n=1 Tax=Rhododendron griersonianum TaxID=479676 RepID=A0AAV6LF50_9ERIC|nr:hypothetical protein RHGRI_005328 [Rhododendron griersonianum]